MDLEKYLKTISIRWFFERTRRAGLSLLLLGVCTSLGCAWRPSFPDLSDLKLPKMPAIKLPKLPDLNPFNDDVGGPQPDETLGVTTIAGSSDVGEFPLRASSFYESLRNRRFNSILTYQDEYLREYFRDADDFDTYYADLTHSLQTAFISKTRPLNLKVQEFSQEEVGVAAVEILFIGDDSRALRPGETDFVRIDRWERHDGQWWLVPGKV